ncbi:MAG: hypothetical protein Q8K93_02330 [Reyranella sp.]|uniref:hypothetical protein n=1 Tax=Reyranella sp. TaxID=1929291 RepID=UPI0027321C0B|nr:hypothetical protein [Reyranella sp.]MDP1961018.1 hypothetical protein [Reyranella sp.]MDP2376252.1 hypothetical protein [Reyranella sp.]
MLIRPLMKRRPDLAYHRQYILIRPVTHYLRCVFFKSGWYGKYFTLNSQVAPLFAADSFLSSHGHSRDGAPLLEHYFEESWTEDPEAAARKVSDLIEQQALPQIADADNPAALANKPWLMERDDVILNACAGGDFDEAERLVADYVGGMEGRLELPRDYSGKNWRKPAEYEPFSIAVATEAHKFHDQSLWRMAYLGKLLQTDRSRVPALLHDWEEFTVNAFKLHKYWTKTPFPCEG